MTVLPSLSVLPPADPCAECAGTGLVRRPWYWLRRKGMTPFAHCTACDGNGYVPHGIDRAA